MGLDPVSRRNLWKIIKDHVQRFHSSVILTTHHMEEAQYLSDDIIIVSNGNIVVQGTNEGLLEKYSQCIYYLYYLVYTIHIKTNEDASDTITYEVASNVFGEACRIKKIGIVN